MQQQIIAEVFPPYIFNYKKLIIEHKINSYKSSVWYWDINISKYIFNQFIN